MRKTKIICTIGPASEKDDKLIQMMEKGMNVARLNFSHGNHEEHSKRIAAVRNIAEAQGKAVAVMLDTKGPEIRTGKLQNEKVKLETGDEFILTSRKVPGNEKEVQLTYPDLPNELKEGDIVLLDDGLINLYVESISNTDIKCRVTNGGELGEKKGVNVPGVRINLPFLSQKDIDDINFGLDQEVDLIAASFVRSSEDVLEIRRILEGRNVDIDIIAKIESQEGVDNLDNIIKVADGVMVARGDLGVEIPAEEVPLVQRNIVEKCNLAGKVVIIATQMLDSMINNPRPTRAEVSDVANAIFDGADAIMLSGESAAGKYPVEAVETMARVASRAEEALSYQDILRQKQSYERLSITDAVSYATCTTAMGLGVSTIVTTTRSGRTARRVAKYRPQANIIAVTPERKVLNKLALVWGVYPVLGRETSDTDDALEEALRVSLEAGYINKGDLVVITGGDPRVGGTNLLKVRVVGDVMVQGMGIGSEAVSGRIKVIVSDEDFLDIMDGDILVTQSADSRFGPYMGRIKALIAEEGGLTSDAAIMGLTMGIPVIVGAKDACSILSNDMMVTVDTPHGNIYRGIGVNSRS